MTDAKTHDADFQGSFFALEIDALTLGWFTGCSGLSLEFDVTTYKESNGKKVIERKRPGKPKYSEVVLKRGFTTNKVDPRLVQGGRRRHQADAVQDGVDRASTTASRPSAPGSASRRAGRRRCRSPTSAPAATT